MYQIFVLTSCSQETMVHELLLKLIFRIEYNTSSTLETRMKRKEQEKAQIYKEVWDGLIRDLEQNHPNYSHCLKVFDEIRDGIKCLYGTLFMCVSSPHRFLSENDVCPDVGNHAAPFGEIIHMHFTKDQIQKEVYGCHWLERVPKTYE